MSARDVTDNSDGFSNNDIPCSSEILPSRINDSRHELEIGSEDTDRGTGIDERVSRQLSLPDNGASTNAMIFGPPQYVIRIRLMNIYGARKSSLVRFCRSVMDGDVGHQNLSISELENLSNDCRKHIVRMIHKAGAGHPGGSLSAIDIIVALYGTRLRFDRNNPDWSDRDRFVMSKGHASPAVYSILHEMGFLSESDLSTFRTLGSVCQGHVDMKWTDGVDFSAGSLGMGLSFGLGCAIAARMDSSSRETWVMVGDGELQEGQVWEAMMAANFHEVSGLKMIVDRNRIQNDDFVNVQMEVGDVASKISSFGWNVKEIDGHDMSEIVGALKWASEQDSAPSAIVAHTTKGKGISFMEDNPSFHGKAPSDEELSLALEELS
jgi:transketolase|tara:strand:- start:6818 stop:7954 length:1137 start_codon:yes stop_codon:yes gene_type:complete